MKEILFFKPSWSNWQYCKLRWVFFSFLLTFHYWHWHSILLSADATNGIFGTAASLIPYFVHQFLGSDLKQLPLKQTYFLFLWWLLIARPSQFTKVKKSSKDLKTVLSKKYLPCNLVSSISFHYKRKAKKALEQFIHTGHVHIISYRFSLPFTKLYRMMRTHFSF